MSSVFNVGIPARSGSQNVANLIRQLRNGIFGTLTVLQRKLGTPSPLLTHILSITQFSQMLHFTLARPAGFPWSGPTMAVAGQVISFATPITWFPIMSRSRGSATGLFYLAITWEAFFVLLFIWAVFCFLRNHWPAVWPLHVLRAIAKPSTSILYIPILTMVLRGLACSAPGAQPLSELECGTFGYSIILGVVTILTVLFVSLCSLFTLVFYDGNFLSASVDAKAHGRAEFLSLIIRTVLVVFIDIFPLLLGPWLNFFLCVTAAVAWLATSIFLMPFYSPMSNRLNIIYSMCFSWSCACLAVSLNAPLMDVGIQFFMGLPFAALAALFVHNARVTQIVRTPADRLSTPYDVELKARFMIHSAMFGHATDRVTVLEDSVAEMADLRMRTGDVSEVASLLSQNPNSKPIDTSASSSVAVGRRGTKADIIGGEEEDDPEEERAEVVRSFFPEKVATDVVALYKASTLKFRQSSMLHVFFARVYKSLLDNRHLQLSHLLQAERIKPPIDVSFIAFQARKAAEEDGSGSQLNALARVTFDKHLNDSRRSVQRAAHRQLSFFTELLNPRPALYRLHRLSSEMTKAIAESERAFTELFSLDPQSILALRLYSSFNEHVLCDSEKAAILMSEADRIEDMRSKDPVGNTSNATASFMSQSGLDIMGDATAVVTVLSAPRHFGLISQANTATAKLFGYARLQLERRSVFSLLPKPIAAHFQNILQTYMHTGEGELATTRVVFGLHSSGHSFPMLFSMREAPPTEGPPTFIVLARPLAVPEIHVILDGDFICAASLSASAMLGVNAAQLAALGAVDIRDAIPSWDAALPNLRGAKGEIVVINKLSSAGITNFNEVDGDNDDGREDDSGSDMASVSANGADDGDDDSTPVRAYLESFASSSSTQMMHVLRMQLVSSGDVYQATKLSSRTVETTDATVKFSELTMPKAPPAEASVIEAGESSDGGIVPGPPAEPPPMSRSAPSIVSPKSLTRFQSTTIRSDSMSSKAAAAASRSDSSPRALSPNQVIQARASASVKSGAAGSTSKKIVGSISSDSSGASSTRKSSQRLRRLLTAPNQPLLPGLSFLRIVGLFVSGLALALAAVVAVQTQQSFNQYRINLTYTMNSAMRITTNFNIILALEILIANAKGYAVLSSDEEAKMRAALVHNATLFQNLQSTAFSYISTTPKAYYYTTPSVLVTKFDDFKAGLDGISVYMNLQDGLDYFVLQATLAANLSNSRLADDDERIVKFLLVNGMSGGNLHDRMSATLATGFDLSIKAASSLLNNQMIVFYTMLSLLGCITIFVFIPIIVFVQYSKDSLTASFVSIPHLVRLLLQREVERRLRLLQVSYADEDDGAAEDLVGFDNAEMGGVPQNTFGLDKLVEVFSVKVNGEDELDWSRIVQVASRQVGRSKDKLSRNSILPLNEAAAIKKNPVRRSVAPFLSLLFRFIVPMMALFAYYTTLYMISVKTVGEVMTVQAALAGSSYRHSCSRAVLADLRRDMMAYGDRAFMSVRFETLHEARDCVLFHQELLMFGLVGGHEDFGSYVRYSQPTETGTFLDLTAADNAAVYAAQHSDACAWILSSDVDSEAGTTTWPVQSAEQCAKFSGGLLTRGLQAAAITYMTNIDAMAQRRMQARLYVVNETAKRSGLGVLLPSAGYNYSADSAAKILRTSTLNFETLSHTVSPFPPSSFKGDVSFPSFWATAPAGTMNYSVRDEMAGEEMQWLTQMDALYLTPGFAKLTRLYFTTGNRVVSDLINFIALFTGVFYGVFILYMVGFYLPQIQSTNHDIISKKTILLLLPFPVVQGVPLLAAAMASIFADDVNGGRDESASTKALVSASSSIINILSEEKQLKANEWSALGGTAAIDGAAPNVGAATAARSDAFPDAPDA